MIESKMFQICTGLAVRNINVVYGKMDSFCLMRNMS